MRRGKLECRLRLITIKKRIGIETVILGKMKIKTKIKTKAKRKAETDGQADRHTDRGKDM